MSDSKCDSCQANLGGDDDVEATWSDDGTCCPLCLRTYCDRCVDSRMKRGLCVSCRLEDGCELCDKDAVTDYVVCNGSCLPAHGRGEGRTLCPDDAFHVTSTNAVESDDVFLCPDCLYLQIEPAMKFLVEKGKALPAPDTKKKARKA